MEEQTTPAELVNIDFELVAVKLVSNLLNEMKSQSEVTGPMYASEWMEKFTFDQLLMIAYSLESLNETITLIHMLAKIKAKSVYASGDIGTELPAATVLEELSAKIET